MVEKKMENSYEYYKNFKTNLDAQIRTKLYF